MDTVLSFINEIMQNIFNSKERATYITPLKAGMTNDSFLVGYEGSQYVFRVNGIGTEVLIDRQNELKVYEALKKTNLGCCEPIIAIDASKGYKVTAYMEKVHNCNPHNWHDVELAMKALRSLHEAELTAAKEVDITELLEFYERMRGGVSKYKDYKARKEQVLSLIPFINTYASEKVLCHFDAVADNFLIDDADNVTIIDWEYACMCDPHIDIAMFSVYSYFSKEDTDKLIAFYLGDEKTDILTIKIYCYISLCGLLWSNWCEYKESLGIHFKGYAQRQYDAAQYYYNIAKAEMERLHIYA